MKKICFVNTSVPWGGGEKWQFETMLHYIDSHQVILLTTPNGELYKKAKYANIETIPIRVGNISFLNPVQVIKVYRLMKQLSVETIMFNTSKDFKLFTMPAKWAGVKNILYRRDNGKPLKSHLINKYLLRKGVTSFLPCSEYIGKMALSKNPNLFPGNKIVVIHNSIDLEQWDKTEVSDSTPGQIPIFSCVGRLSDEKGQLFLPKIASILKNRKHQFKILIAGTGPLEIPLMDEIKKHGVEDCFTLLGFRNDIKKIMHQTNCLLIPSKWEGLPTVALEAMAAGKPAIAFNVAGNPEIVINNETGYLIKPFDEEAFANAMEKFISDKELFVQLGSEGRKLVERKFSRSVTNKLLDRYF